MRNVYIDLHVKKKNKPKKPKSNSFTYLLFFIVTVLISISISLSIRLVHSIGESSFKGSHFTIAVINKGYYLYNINTSDKTVSVVEIKNSEQDLTRLSRQAISLSLGIPIDAIIVFKDGSGFTDTKDLFSFQNVYSVLLHSSHYSLIGLNGVDMVKLYLNGVPSSYKTKSYNTYPADYDLEDVEVKSLLFDYFKNKEIINEGVSVQIMNASGVDGVGAKVANMLKNTGFNVVSVISGDVQKNSLISTSVQDGPAVENLKSVFTMPWNHTNDSSAVADISIIVGKDYFSK